MTDLTVYLSSQLHRPVEDHSGPGKTGLRLESAKAPQQVLVIDDVKKPGDN
jgi:hypothetical protein